MQYDNIKWENASLLYTEKSYSLARKNQGKFYHLFSNHNNQSLPFINNKSQPGFLYDQFEIHDAIINIRDYANNKTEVRAFFSSDTMPKYDYTVNFQNDSCIIVFESKNNYRPFFYLNSKDQSDLKILADYEKLNNKTFLITNIHSPFDVVEVFAKNSLGHKSKSSFHISPINNYYKISGDLVLNHYEHGIIIKFIESKMSGQEAYLILNKKNEKHRYELNSISLLEHSSKILSPLEMNDVSEIKVYYNTDIPHEVFKTKQWGSIVLPDSSFNFPLINEKLIINGQENTFYDTVYIWANIVDISPPPNGELVSYAYQIFPRLIPFNKPIEIGIKFDIHYLERGHSIYYYNEEKQSWHYMPSHFNSDSTYLLTKILSGEIFAIMKELEPPLLTSIIPDINGTYYSSDIDNISFNVEDKIAGIEGETDVYLELDKKRVIFEYNSYQKKIRYPLLNNLKKGEHTLYIEAKDRVGNKSSIRGTFFIK